MLIDCESLYPGKVENLKSGRGLSKKEEARSKTGKSEGTERDKREALLED